MTVLDAIANGLFVPLSPAPEGMHWQPQVTKSDEGSMVRFTATYRLVPTIVFPEDD
jgi:hypothetical protein